MSVHSTNWAANLTLDTVERMIYLLPPVTTTLLPVIAIGLLCYQHRTGTGPPDTQLCLCVADRWREARLERVDLMNSCAHNWTLFSFGAPVIRSAPQVLV